MDITWTDNSSHETSYKVERSDDGGTTWNDISGGISLMDAAEFYVPYVMDPSNSSRLVPRQPTS